MTALALPAFDDNYFWALRSRSGAVVFDPGDAAVVMGYLHESAQSLYAVLVTHHHWDHIDGIAPLKEQFPDLRVIGPKDARITGVTEFVVEGDSVDLSSELRFDVMETPGHTLSHISYVRRGELFCGDTMFSLGCGRLFEGSPAQMLHSLDRLAALDDETKMHCSHEYTLANARFAINVDPHNAELKAYITAVRLLRDQGLPSVPTTIKIQRRCNPFLRVDEPAVIASVERHAGRALTDRTDVFTNLRLWKDSFR